jgi:hypothetical protein
VGDRLPRFRSWTKFRIEVRPEVAGEALIAYVKVSAAETSCVELAKED